VTGLARVLELFADDVVAQLDALVTNKDRRARNQLANFVLGFAAKGTVEEFAVLALAAALILLCLRDDKISELAQCAYLGRSLHGRCTGAKHKVT
jgi:hypothetical protein